MVASQKNQISYLLTITVKVLFVIEKLNIGLAKAVTK